MRGWKKDVERGVAEVLKVAVPFAAVRPPQLRRRTWLDPIAADRPAVHADDVSWCGGPPVAHDGVEVKGHGASERLREVERDLERGSGRPGGHLGPVAFHGAPSHDGVEGAGVVGGPIRGRAGAGAIDDGGRDVQGPGEFGERAILTSDCDDPDFIACAQREQTSCRDEDADEHGESRSHVPALITR